MNANHVLLFVLIFVLSSGIFRSLGLSWPKSLFVAGVAIVFALAAGTIALTSAP